MKKFAGLVGILSILFLIFAAPTAFAGSEPVALQWDYSSPPADLAGFRIYASLTPDGQVLGAASADLVVEVPYVEGQTTYTSENPITAPDGEETVYYFVATAFDDSGNESEKSNEVSTTLDFKAPPPFTITIPTEPVQ